MKHRFKIEEPRFKWLLTFKCRHCGYEIHLVKHDVRRWVSKPGPPTTKEFSQIRRCSR